MVRGDDKSETRTEEDLTVGGEGLGSVSSPGLLGELLCCFLWGWAFLWLVKHGRGKEGEELEEIGSWQFVTLLSDLEEERTWQNFPSEESTMSL